MDKVTARELKKSTIASLSDKLPFCLTIDGKNAWVVLSIAHYQELVRHYRQAVGQAKREVSDAHKPYEIIRQEILNESSRTPRV